MTEKIAVEGKPPVLALARIKGKPRGYDDTFWVTIHGQTARDANDTPYPLDDLDIAPSPEGDFPQTLSEAEAACRKTLQQIQDFRDGKSVPFVPVTTTAEETKNGRPTKSDNEPDSCRVQREDSSRGDCHAQAGASPSTNGRGGEGVDGIAGDEPRIIGWGRTSQHIEFDFLGERVEIMKAASGRCKDITSATIEEIAEKHRSAAEAAARGEGEKQEMNALSSYTCNGSPKGCEGERFGGCAYCDAPQRTGSNPAQVIEPDFSQPLPSQPSGPMKQFENWLESEGYYVHDSDSRHEIAAKAEELFRQPAQAERGEVERLRRQKQCLQIERDHALGACNEVFNGLEWNGDGYEWNPKSGDYRERVVDPVERGARKIMEELDALRASVTTAERQLSELKAQRSQWATEAGENSWAALAIERDGLREQLAEARGALEKFQDSPEAEHLERERKIREQEESQPRFPIDPPSIFGT